MKIHGIQKLTLVDFPSHPASILFCGNCNFRCPFCQNAPLVLNPDNEPLLDNDEIMAFLRKRKRMLEGVVVTGGEPTLEKDLIPFLYSLKSLGYLVKLDTNGYMPEVLKRAVKEKVVDYVAMDIKSSLDEYPILCGVKDIDTKRIEESIEFLMSDQVDYEFRTTVVEPLNHKENFEKIGEITKGCLRYYLQSFVDSGNIIGKN